MQQSVKYGSNSSQLEPLVPDKLWSKCGGRLEIIIFLEKKE